MTHTARMTTAEVAAVLVSELGGTLVAVLAEVKDRKLPYRWAKGTRPRANAEVKLRTAMDVWKIVTAEDGPDVGRAWFIGCNPDLGDQQPFMALREGRLSEVLAAARSFARDF